MPKLLSKSSVFFNSENALLETADCSFTILLNHQTLGIDDNSYLKLTLNQLTLRNTIQTISIYNNTLYFNGQEIFIPTGQLTFTDVQAYLATFGITYTIDSTNHLLFTCSGSISFATHGSCAGILGFEPGSTYTLTGNNRAPFRFLLGDYDLLYLKTSLDTNSLEIDVNGNTEISNILCPIPNVSAPGKLLVYTDLQGTYSVMSRNIQSMNQIRVQIVDVRGNPIVAEDVWTLALTLEYYTDVDSDILASIENLNRTMGELLRLSRMKIIHQNISSHKKTNKNKHR